MEFSLILGYILAIAIGLTMGAMGSGGSILTLPIFVYLFHLEPIQAVDYSLFTISIVSLLGSIGHVHKKEIDFKTTALFIFPSLISVYIAKHYILPSIPDRFFIDQVSIHKDQIIMSLFSLIIIASALAMIIKRDDNSKVESPSYSTIILIVLGFITGILTGLVGAGGGFIIVPSLVLLLKITIKQATAASLFIIAINTSFGLLSNFQHLDHINWTILIIFTGITLMGLMIGFQLKTKLKPEKLKIAFGYFLGAIGIAIAGTEISQFINL
ncbi:sulfite exporter TauE/SafE family protein [Sphingobacterium faecium]|uniref:sulfite exporter TauE/SafE family protein n=1 Tax=Sphingobacterium faecium TaxID=34087 RepID=UPI0024683E8F|nr:sulfite exporter TauE/SafE family protein [Sphingobacterium faecium]MDH5828308.1 sulfite exporter TauE/SafE family protein [Sphingobacterium faecium]